MVSKRKRQKSQRSNERRNLRRRRTLDILKALDLWSDVENTSRADDFLDVHYPVPNVSLAESAKSSTKADEILRLTTKAVNNCRRRFPILGEQFPVVDYFTTVMPILDLLRRVRTSDPELNKSFVDAKIRLAELASPETGAKAMLDMGRAVADVLIEYGRIDTSLYSIEPLFGRNERQKWAIGFEIQRHAACRREVEIEGKRRPAFKCGQPARSGEIDWVEWTGDIIGKPSNEKYPVFVQSHALDNLYGKGARALFITDGEHLVHDYLWLSLREPRIIQQSRHREDFLIEYFFNVHKLGYLLARVVDGVVVVRTFLFLTMNGTPEGDRLRQRLRLRKDDIRHLELDRIETFLHTDIQHDPELRRLLDECGCGHLFSIWKEPQPLERCVPDRADEMRKFLRLDA